MFISGVRRDIPAFDASGLEINFQWKEKHGSLDKANIGMMNEWVDSIKVNFFSLFLKNLLDATKRTSL